MPITELDVVDVDRQVETWINDCGPGGVVALVRGLVYRDLGPPTPDIPDAPTVLEATVVRDALRAFHDPAVLAASPLARGSTTAERAAMVQALLREATGGAFGATDEERRQRDTIERGYLDPDGGHAAAPARCT